MKRFYSLGLCLFYLVVMSGCEKYELDRRMAELCEKDGGLKLYETVKLPTSMFDEDGYPFPGWRQRSNPNRLNSEYQLIEEKGVLKDGNSMEGEGRLLRIKWTITRKSDGKLFGEAVQYIRIGGDLIAFPHSTSKVCPLQINFTNVIRAVFIKDDV